GHDYSDGPNEVSLGWGPSNNTHTILIRGDGMAYYLVDFTRGRGFSNYRALPAAARPGMDLRFSFSSVAGQERIAYVINGPVEAVQHRHDAGREHWELPSLDRAGRMASAGQERRVVRRTGGRANGICLEQSDQPVAHPFRIVAERAPPRARRALHRPDERQQ